MKNKILYPLIIIYVIISNLIGREIGFIPLIGSFKYTKIFFLLILPLISYSNFKNIFLRNELILLFILSLIAPIHGFVNGEIIESPYNITMYLLFYVLAYQAFYNKNSIYLLFKIILWSWIIIVIFREILFHNYGVSLLSFANLRGVGDIRQSSDTINSLSLIIVIYFFLKIKTSKSKIRIYDIMPLVISFFVVIRYGVRSSYVAIILLFITFYLIQEDFLLNKNMKIRIVKILFIFTITISVIFIIVSDISINLLGISLVEYLQKSGSNLVGTQKYKGHLTMLWRTTMWIDNINNFFSKEFYLIKINNNPININYTMTHQLGFMSYENPHNSYIFLLLNFGLLPFLLFIYIIYKILKVIYPFIGVDYWTRFIFYSLLAYIILAFFTPIFELPYQGPIFWILAGAGVRRANSLRFDMSFPPKTGKGA